MESNDIEALKLLANEKVSYGENLLQILTKYERIEGAQKLFRKIGRELAFLKKIYNDKKLKKEHLQCSNLTHLGALISKLQLVEDCVSINQVFNLDDRKITVDIVSNQGLCWYKVIARNPKSLSQISSGDTEYGVRSVLDQAEDYTRCAQMYPRLFQTPKIVFVFANGIGQGLAKKLEQFGITVEGTRVPNIDEDEYSEYSEKFSFCTDNTLHIKRINVDVSTMLAYTSSVTNGSCGKYRFTTPVLIQQAEWESQRPIKPILDAFFDGKKLYCCVTARDSFMSIVNTVGGSSEKVRAKQFLQRITVLSDDATDDDIGDCDDIDDSPFCNIQFTADKKLPIGGKIKERSLVIFTFGDRIRAVTVTSNDGFVRAARQKGINFVVYVHESRALTEQKELKTARLA